MSDLIVPPDLLGYSGRQIIALERPENNPAKDLHCTNDPHKRHVSMYKHGKVTLHLATSLWIALSDRPEWVATVGFIEPVGDFADHKVERRSWTPDMLEAAGRELSALVKMPRDDVMYRTAWRTASRPSEKYVFWDVSPREKDMIIASQSGFYQPIVRIRDPRWANEDE